MRFSPEIIFISRSLMSRNFCRRPRFQVNLYWHARPYFGLKLHVSKADDCNDNASRENHDHGWLCSIFLIALVIRYHGKHSPKIGESFQLEAVAKSWQIWSKEISEFCTREMLQGWKMSKAKSGEKDFPKNDWWIEVFWWKCQEFLVDRVSQSSPVMQNLTPGV